MHRKKYIYTWAQAGRRAPRRALRRAPPYRSTVMQKHRHAEARKNREDEGEHNNLNPPCLHHHIIRHCWRRNLYYNATRYQYAMDTGCCPLSSPPLPPPFSPFPLPFSPSPVPLILSHLSNPLGFSCFLTTTRHDTTQYHRPQFT